MPCSITYHCHIYTSLPPSPPPSLSLSLSLRVSDVNKESTLPSESIAVTPNEPSLDPDKETTIETKDIKAEG